MADFDSHTTYRRSFNTTRKNRSLKSFNKELDKNKDRMDQSWDFTPFPKYLFPSEKKSFIKSFNNLYFQKSKEENTDVSCYIVNTEPNEEVKGDISKHKSPAYSFGLARQDCKLPFIDLHEKIAPCPGSYNIRPEKGISPFSLKYSINKEKILRAVKNNTGLGPGQYHHNKCDIVTHGKFPLSTYINTPISSFGTYKEIRMKGFESQGGFNVRPEPATYNINNSLSMFTGTGKYPISTFRSSRCKKIKNNINISRNTKNIGPGPGTYNHHSLFLGSRYSK